MILDLFGAVVHFFLGVVFFVYLFVGMLGVYEYRLYTDEQRSRASILMKIHIALMVLASLLGFGGLVLLSIGRETPYLFSYTLTTGIVGLAIAVLELMLQKTLEIDRSPLMDQLVQHIG